MIKTLKALVTHLKELEEYDEKWTRKDSILGSIRLIANLTSDIPKEFTRHFRNEKLTDHLINRIKAKYTIEDINKDAFIFRINAEAKYTQKIVGSINGKEYLFTLDIDEMTKEPILTDGIIYDADQEYLPAPISIKELTR